MRLLACLQTVVVWYQHDSHSLLRPPGPGSEFKHIHLNMDIKYSKSSNGIIQVTMPSIRLLDLLDKNPPDFNAVFQEKSYFANKGMEDALSFLNEAKAEGRYLLIGPPGNGKSTASWIATSASGHEHEDAAQVPRVHVWMDGFALQGILVVEGKKITSAILPVKGKEKVHLVNLIGLLSDWYKGAYLIIDGVIQGHAEEGITRGSVGWILVSSVCIQFRTNQTEGFEPEVHQMDS